MTLKIKVACFALFALLLLCCGGTYAQEIQIIPSPVAPPPFAGGQVSPPGVVGAMTQPPTAPAGAGVPGQGAVPVTPPSGYSRQPMPPAPGQPTPATPLTARPHTAVLPGQAAPVAYPGVLPQAGLVQEEPPSAFELFVSGQAPTTISFDIKQFGYDLFREAFPTVQPAQPLPGTAIPGQTQGLGFTPSPMISQPGNQGAQFGAQVQNVPVSVDYVIGPGDEIRVTVWGSVEGNWNVTVDRDGNISLPKIGILGITGLKFQEFKEVLQNEFSKYYTDFQMNVSMGALKSIRIYVVGNARNPGAFLVSSLSTVINGLISAGGPSKSGSMRNIQLKRNGETVANIDLYDFLIRGNKARDVKLMPEDVIFIPPIGSLVGIAGNVERPAIYEMKGRIRLSEAIKLAGGVTADAYLHRVQVERVHQRKSKVLLDLDLQKVRGNDDILLQDGDIIKVFPITSLVTNRVVLQGNVRRPGEYEWKPGMRVRDLIRSFDDLLPETLFEYAVVERLVPPENHQEYRTFDLGAALRGTDQQQNICLQPHDTVRIYNKWEMMEKEKVRIAGAVNKPGEFEYRPNMKVSDLIKLSGGLKRFAFDRTAELTRVVPTDFGPRTDVIVVNPSAALAGDPDCDIVLQQDDYLFIRTVPDWQLYRKVVIYGQVKFPGEYALTKGETISSLIERAGGFTDQAYVRGATFTRKSVKDIQQQQINELVSRIEMELLAAASAEGGSGLDRSEVAGLELYQRQKKLFVDSLKYIEAKGRMVVQIDEPSRMKNTLFDLELEEGDTLYVPSNPQVIQVVGAVMNQSGFTYEPGKDHGYYVARAGGMTRTADKSKVFIMKVDGTAVQPGKGFFWDSSSRRWASGAAGVLEPGDIVVVPQRLDKTAWLKETRDLVQILYQIAVGAGVLLRL